MTVKDRLKITEKRLKSKKNERILKCALFFMLGMLFSLGSVFGELRPFGVSITAVSKKRYFLFTAAGAAFATLFTGLDGSSARYMCAITLAALGALASAAFELGEHEIYPLNISAIEDKFGRMRVEILTDSDFGLNNPKLAPEIGRACSRYFDKGIITNFKNETMLSFF
ncbi:MAG: hypothetical protein IKI33_03955 [Eubacterium sp.]|nr:hypothetical protein [Eubacterium sp.]